MFLNFVSTRDCFLLGFVRSEIDIHRNFRSYGYFTIVCRRAFYCFRRISMSPAVTNLHHIVITYCTVDAFQNASKWKRKTALWRKTAPMAHFIHCVLIHSMPRSGSMNIGAIPMQNTYVCQMIFRDLFSGC